MNSTGQRSAAVMASGVIAILGSLVTAIGILIGMMGLLLASRFPTPTPNPMDTMPGLRVMTAAIMAIFFAVTIWGAFSGVGIIRLRNWARISVLVWSGIAAPMCAMAILFVAFMPMPPSPNPTMLRTMIHVVTVLFYGGPLAIAVWWLILFTRPKVVAQFKPVAVAAGPGDPFGAIPVTATVDASGSQVAYAVPGPSIPLPIIVLSCFFLLSSLSVFFIFFTHMPAMVFGHAYTGLTGSVIYGGWCLLYAIAGVGMLRRVSWTYTLAIGLQILGIVSGIITLLSPNFDNVMRRAMSTTGLPVNSEMYQMPSMAHLRGFSLIGLLFPVAILGLMVYYRPRFLEACASKGGNSSAPDNSTTPGDSASQTPSQTIEPVA
jgi:hypothetical protein